MLYLEIVRSREILTEPLYELIANLIMTVFFDILNSALFLNLIVATVELKLMC